ncbi:hypothetical protein [Blastococcus saxobsidens]|uniref:Uncharacterized protein n=1 Tax=Blastococcus saxobsidens TaxID=138336 RepID=A0A4Q7Y324_9ACTN|nr:hypothetical protein [Blastococcus saxobsidens]RZU30471.1 hypothetical protein BKA19_0087 [Blastococcus saxobsidens]
MSARCPDAVPLAWQVLLGEAFRRCADAGYGRVEQRPDGGRLFEAFPGLEDAAADFIELALFGDGGAR